MDEWQLDFEWLKARHYVKDSLDGDELPDIKAILLLIGVQELGFKQTQFTKEEKQDLMHIAVCALLEPGGYFEFQGRDQDGWPHYNQVKPFAIKGREPQETLLKQSIIKYLDI